MVNKNNDIHIPDHVLSQNDSLNSMPPRPLYQQVKDSIIERINSGEWPPDIKIPSENELVESLKVSRMTIHRALRELTTEGKLVRLQGVGTFVAQPKPRSALFEIQSIADEIESRGGVHSSKVHLMEDVKVTDMTPNK